LKKKNRVMSLNTVNKELAYQYAENKKHAAELIIANKELAYQNREKEKRAIELSIAYTKIKKTEEFLKDHIKGLEEMMFMTHHKVRQPVANILGLSAMLKNYLRSPVVLKKLVGYIRVSALDLDAFTRELTTFMTDLDSQSKVNAAVTPTENSPPDL
jgi:hypothetical protein